LTRINCIPVAELTRAHCFSEYRELPRIRHMRPDRHRGKLPPTYRMGAGHVLFFLDKGVWLCRRHATLRARLIGHWGYTGLTIPPLCLDHWPQWAMGDWLPDGQALAVNRARIAERINITGKP
jgi:deoxyribonuclease (pyrimidine dimer)